MTFIIFYYKLTVFNTTTGSRGLLTVAKTVFYKMQGSENMTFIAFIQSTMLTSC